MRYVLQDLLTIRRHRVDKATQAVALCKRELAQAETEQATAIANLDRYRANRIARETTLFDSILAQAILLKKLEDVKAEIQLLRFEELEYEQRVLDAQRGVADALKRLEQAEVVLRKAIRSEWKLDEHRKMWTIEMGLEMIRKEDLEIEDLILSDKKMLRL